MKRRKAAARPNVLRDLFGIGIMSGVVYFAFSLLRFFPSEQLRLMKSGFLKFNLFAYSLTLWMLAFIILSGLLHLIVYPLIRSSRKALRMTGRVIVYFVICTAILIGHAVWLADARTALMLPYFIKIQEVKNLVLWAVLIAGLASLVLGVAHGYLRPRPRRKCAVPLVRVGVICLVYVVIVNLPFDYANLGGIPDGGPYPGRTKTVVFGVDAGSWNVILPLVERGDLPAFQRIVDEGTWGYIDTHGRRYTPPSWTSIATGKREEKHGVHSFGNVSNDWTAAPIWSILSSKGKRVGVVNWVCTWPPFEVNGGFVSSIMEPRPGSSYFSEEFAGYTEVADSILAGWGPGIPFGSETVMEFATREISQLRRIHEEVLSELEPDFAAYFYFHTDALQHLFWKDLDPAAFTGKDWADETPDPAYSRAIEEGWLWADSFLSDLMETYGEYAYYIVVSDHGARPIERRQVLLDIVALLEELGYLTTQDGEIRYESSVCYPSSEGSYNYIYNLELNPVEYMVESEIDWVRYEDIRGKIVENLKSVRLADSGKPIFGDVVFPDRMANPDACDIRLFGTRAIREMPPRGSMMVVGGDEVEIENLLRFGFCSGRHRSRGIFLAKGPAIKHRFSGAWTIDEPYTRIFRQTHGIFEAMDPFYTPFRRLHIVDEIMNLDITPTLLHLFDLPVAEDMDGRVITEIIERDFKDLNPLQTVKTYKMGEILSLRAGPGEEQRIRKMKERLKALGYIQ